MKLYLLRYNNYYNRLVKREIDSIYPPDAEHQVEWTVTALEKYQQYLIGDPIEGVNFIENDGVNTEQVINWAGEHPDYVVVTDEENNLTSRWFVISERRTTHGQLLLALRRDLIVDYYNDVMSAPTFVEKGFINDPDDPAIFNQESLTFNQIKTREIELADESGCPWVVGYVPRDASLGKIGPISFPIFNAAEAIEVNGINNWEYNKYRTGRAIYTPQKATVYTTIQGDSFGFFTSTVKNYRVPLTYNIQTEKVSKGECYYASTKASDRFYTIRVEGKDYFSGYQTNFDNIANAAKRSLDDSISFYKTNKSQIITSAQGVLANYYGVEQVDQVEYNEIKALNGTLLYDNDSGIYYSVGISTERIPIEGIPVNNNATLRSQYLDSIFPTMPTSKISTIVGASVVTGAQLNASVDIAKSNDTNTSWRLTGYADVIRLEVNQVSLEVQTQVPADRLHLSDSPYDMFCMPYAEGLTIYNGETELVKSTSKFAALFMAQAVATSLGSGAIYDIQILPYCPFRECLTEKGIDVSVARYSTIDSIDSQNPDVVSVPQSVMIWCNKSTFSFPIAINIPEETDAVLKKIEHLTKKYRLCSPNYSGAFEFSPQMNGGLTTINVDCTYKPFNPYIHLAPDFGGLYGDDYNDARGLICGGDFSTAQVQSAWADYQMQNKNYLAIFDRQIENLELTQSIERKREKVAAVAGVISGGISGAASGAQAGGVAGPYGAAIGAGIGLTAGAGLSAYGAIKDIEYNNALRREALDYRNDMFQMQMENIQALPQGLAKTSADTANNKYIPFIEVYTSDVEGTSFQADALRNKIKYNGMTIERIDVLNNYIRNYMPQDINSQGDNFDYGPTYIKGRLIRLEELAEDYHIAVALADEVFQGVFMPVEIDEEE